MINKVISTQDLSKLSYKLKMLNISHKNMNNINYKKLNKIINKKSKKDINKIDNKKMTNKSIKDISGFKYGKLTVVGKSENYTDKNKLYNCICECGNTIEVNRMYLIGGHKKSCGCMRKRIELKTGDKFGELKVVAPLNKKINGSMAYKCECYCGKIVNVPGNQLVSGHKKSCGCLKMGRRLKIGSKYGMLEIISDLDEKINGKLSYVCRCDCGNIVNTEGYRLTSGYKKSCGCLKYKHSLLMTPRQRENYERINEIKKLLNI